MTTVTNFAALISLHVAQFTTTMIKKCIFHSTEFHSQMICYKYLSFSNTKMIQSKSKHTQFSPST